VTLPTIAATLSAWDALGATSVHSRAAKYLTEKIAASNTSGPTRSRVTFDTIAHQWLTHMMPL